jgi:hypothetical protein
MCGAAVSPACVALSNVVSLDYSLSFRCIAADAYLAQDTFWSRVNIPKVLKATEAAHMWAEQVRLLCARRIV